VDLILSLNNLRLASEVCSHGVSNFVVDWEDLLRKHPYSSLHDKKEILDMFRKSLKSQYIITRTIASGEQTEHDINMAVSSGTNEVMISGITEIDQICHFKHLLEHTNVSLSVVLETNQLLSKAKQLSQINLSRIHLGLFDLTNSLKYSSLFKLLSSGVMESTFELLAQSHKLSALSISPELGSLPISAHLVAAKMVSMGASYMFLRRSFQESLAELSIDEALKSIRCMFDEIARLDMVQLQAKVNDFSYQVDALDASGAVASSPT
jgi:coenzyme F420-reducing hydrogenase delta subunit